VRAGELTKMHAALTVPDTPIRLDSVRLWACQDRFPVTPPIKTPHPVVGRQAETLSLKHSFPVSLPSTTTTAFARLPFKKEIAPMSSHGIPEVLMKKVDEYVDSLAPQIQPRIAQELDLFQQKTIDGLEEQVIDAFRSLFNKDRENSENRNNSRGLDDGVPDAYGGQSLPFANEITDLSRGFSNIAGKAGDDLRDIFDLTETRGAPDETRSRGGAGGHSDNFRGFFSAAVQAVQDHLDDNSKPGQQSFQLDGLLGVISNTVKDATRNPEEKARLISPEIKETVGAKLREQHAPIAEQFTRIALDHIKRWLRGNTSTRDLGDGVKGEIEDQVKDLVRGLGGLFKNKDQPSQGSSRGFNDQDRDQGGQESGGGFSKVISEKLSTGLARVHREVRLEFRKVLAVIEKQLFELLPDQFQRPLEKILGGNPFDSQLDREARPQADRGFGDDIKAKLVDKIRGLVRKVQEALRESILAVVNGGHRKFEHESWVFVQNMVEQKVQKYLPKVKISVPDDIGNEGVSVGAPTSNVQLGGGHQQVPQNQFSDGAQHPPQGQPGGGYQHAPQGQPGGGYQHASQGQPGSGYPYVPQNQHTDGYQHTPQSQPGGGYQHNAQSHHDGGYQQNPQSQLGGGYQHAPQSQPLGEYRPEYHSQQGDGYQHGPQSRPGGGYQRDYQSQHGDEHRDDYQNPPGEAGSYYNR